ncbi:Acyl-CoA:lysophosphatidylglycerol acyltransferase 1 [Gryllus bimaculatus]|nr:Acyl-CoA:lysophosphatidylglycerol acyltransferase 1 [Gryllus bimaculatus]
MRWRMPEEPRVRVAVVELGDDIRTCLQERTLVIANHQSTADVPLLMATFNTRRHVLPNLMWIMDRVFKYTNFGIVSIIHQDFFIVSISVKDRVKPSDLPGNYLVLLRRRSC